MGDGFVLGKQDHHCSLSDCFHHHRSGDLSYVHVPRGLMVVLRTFNGAEHTTFRTKMGFLSQKNSCTYLISFYL